MPVRRGPLKPITGIATERILGRCLAVFTLVFGAQAVPFALMQQQELRAPWSIVVVVGLYASLLVTMAAGFAGRGVEYVAPVVPILYLVAMLTWPLTVRDPATVQPSVPWLWFVCNLVLATAVFAFEPIVAAVYLVIVPGVFFLVRQTPSGGGASVVTALLDSSYTVILGTAVLVIVVLLRRAALEVDTAQGVAVTRYGDAVREHATEIERIQVDSIVHDGVLTALLSAAKADTPRARALATVMAQASMDRLVSAAEAPRAIGKAVPLSRISERLTIARDHLDPAARVSAPDDVDDQLQLPADIAQTLVDAAVQALVNSAQHAGENASRWITVARDGETAVVIVGDDGEGFDPSIRSERLGVRVSIVERIENCGGAVTIESAPGRGTVVTLRWSAGSAAVAIAQPRPASIRA